MSTDFSFACFTCKEKGPSFASSSISYGYKVWNEDEWRAWLGHRKACGYHEGHDLRIISEDTDLTFDSGEVEE